MPAEKKNDEASVKVFKIASVNEDKRGSIEIWEENIHFRLGAGRVIKRSYVVGLVRKGGCALNKCKAALQYYDIFGNKEESEFLINESDFKALKSVIKK